MTTLLSPSRFWMLGLVLLPSACGDPVSDALHERCTTPGPGCAIQQRGRSLRYTQTDDALYAIVSGAVGSHFTIEHPGIEFAAVDVLGAELLSVAETDTALNIELSAALDAPAVVVRYTRK